jgi:hypothetical protein
MDEDEGEDELDADEEAPVSLEQGERKAAKGTSLAS